VHLEHVGAGEHFRRRAVTVSLFEFLAIGPGAKLRFIPPMGKHAALHFAPPCFKIA